MLFSYTRISSTRPRILSKSFTLDARGQLVKSTSATLCEGQFSVLTVETLEEFAHKLTRMTPDQATCYGVPSAEAGSVVTTAMLASRDDDAIARSNAFFHWPEGGGILMLDYDPAEGHPSLDREGLMDALRTAVPQLADTRMLWWPSSSSHICREDQDLTGLRGQRLYVLVDRASEIPRVGRLIEDQLWAAGHGYVAVTRSGAMLPRTLVDGCVWQPSRLDFAAGAATGPGLEQRRGDPILIDGSHEYLVTSQMPEVAEDVSHAAESAREEARNASAALAQERRREWRKARTAKLRGQAEFSGFDPDQFDRAVDQRELCRGYPITLVPDGGGERQTLTVGEILAHPERYDRAKTLDPIEPEYRDQADVGMLFLTDGTPRLHSFARGGCTYTLRGRDTVEAPGRTADTTMATLQHMATGLSFFDHGSKLVEVGRAGGISVLDEHVLALRLAQKLKFVQGNGKTAPERAPEVDPPVKVVRQILSLRENRGLPALEAVIDMPTLRLDGSLVDAPGYDPDTGLLLRDTVEQYPRIPEAVDGEGVRRALQTLWYPLSQFPYSDTGSATAALAGLLTAVLRPALPTSPMFVADAALPGSGKTLIVKSLGMLRTGELPSLQVAPDTRDEAEMRKLITASLIDGKTVIAFDNCSGMQKSASLAAFLTSSLWTDRLLGESRMASALPNRALLLVNGSNLAFSEELTRRGLHCRIDPGLEDPYLRSFDFDPVEHVRENRPALVAAALTLVRTHLAVNPNQRGSLASFEDWDRFVGRTVAWIAAEFEPRRFIDPMTLIRVRNQTSEEREDAHAFLVALTEVYGRDWFTAREIGERLAGGVGTDLLVAMGEPIGTGRLPSTKTIGRHLLRILDRPCGGMCLRADQAGNVKKWRVAVNEPPLAHGGG